jgi:hypothetical protein
MNIFYGIVFIIGGTWMIIIQAKKMLIKKTIYFASVIDIFFGICFVIGGVIITVRNTNRFPYAELLYVVFAIIVIIRLAITAVNRINYRIKRR